MIYSLPIPSFNDEGYLNHNSFNQWQLCTKNYIAPLKKGRWLSRIADKVGTREEGLNISWAICHWCPHWKNFNTIHGQIISNLVIKSKFKFMGVHTLANNFLAVQIRFDTFLVYYFINLSKYIKSPMEVSQSLTTLHRIMREGGSESPYFSETLLCMSTKSLRLHRVTCGQKC